MLPTISSSSMGASHRPSKQHSAGNTHRSRPSVTRSHSIFGTLKNIVTAPFTWLATNNEDFAEEKDDQGKRRRVAGSEKTNTIAVGDESRTASDSFGETDEGITRGTKRLRVSSPAGYDRYKESQRVGYNDPPQSAFASNAYVPPNRSASVMLPATTIRPTVDTGGGSRYSRSSTRASSLALQPTVLVDSPTFGQAQPIQRDVSMSSIPSPREHSMDRKTFGIANRPTRAAPPLGRELSLPPTSRPSFVLRSSLTPQPSQSQLLPLITPSRIRRDTSEPPPVSSLRQNPVFVRGPPKNESVHLPSDSVTLGVLVENHRSVRHRFLPLPFSTFMLMFFPSLSRLRASLVPISNTIPFTFVPFTWPRFAFAIRFKPDCIASSFDSSTESFACVGCLQNSFDTDTIEGWYAYPGAF
ncbi:hypothetical protein BDN71DRAFT_1221228 [Pleurotus eryngii]|uniref:Uncharacterized protein n=1 Tax=Pleurotus eryngii TaxID=5323 RepID=A0A9P6D4G1_PLEER|nr:hypothetical protein BDN71DRAFT_1221228 [Pleurotus eryngii]